MFFDIFVPHQVYDVLIRPQMMNEVNNQHLIVESYLQSLFVTALGVFVPNIRFNVLTSTSYEEQNQQSAFKC